MRSCRTHGYGRLHAQLPIRGSLYSSTWRVSACQSVPQNRCHVKRALSTPTPTHRHVDTPTCRHIDTSTHRHAATPGLKRPTPRSVTARSCVSRSRAPRCGDDSLAGTPAGSGREGDVDDDPRLMNHRHTHKVRVIFSPERCDSQVRKSGDEEVRLVLIPIPPE
jgi:hypothetical protein